MFSWLFAKHTFFNCTNDKCNVTSCIIRNHKFQIYSVKELGYGEVKYLGCDAATFRAYIEAQFEPNMSWDNPDIWYIDYIIPIDVELPIVIEHLHYTNLRPIYIKKKL